MDLIIFLQINQSWIEKNADLMVAIVTIVAGALGFVFTRLYDYYFADKFSSKSDLLVKLNEQKISKHGKLKLAGELETAIKTLKGRFPVSKERVPNTGVLNLKERFYIKSLNTDVEVTNCPEDFTNTYVLFYDSEFLAQHPVYNLKEIAEGINRSFEDHKESVPTDLKLFQNKKSINESLEMIFWVKAANYIPENQFKLNEDYNVINEVIKKWLPGNNLILELYLPDDVIQTQGKFVNDFPSKVNQADTSINRFTDLIIVRNYLNTMFSNGFVFGGLSYMHKPIPKEVMVDRIKGIETAFVSNVCNVYGSPGTGKTYLTSQFLKENSNNYLFLVINKTELADTFAKSLQLNLTREVFLSSVIDMILDGSFSLLPPESTKSEETKQITRFLLKSLLLIKKQTLCVVVDDYYIYKDIVEKSIIDILSKDWGIKFMIIGRPQVKEFHGKLNNSITRYECKTWDRDNALLIINDWTQKTNEENTTALQVDWLMKENRFSIYLLRLVVNNMDNIENKSLSTILAEEITFSLNPVFKKLIGENAGNALSYNDLKNLVTNIINSDKTKEEIILQVKTGLQNVATVDIDKFIESIGELSWASRFQGEGRNSTLTTELFRQYLNFVDIDIFRKLASEANILKSDYGAGSIDWNDSLIADGCLSILLRRSLQNVIGDPTRTLQFSGMLEGLRNQNSLNILRLVLDSDALLQLTKVVASTNFDRIDLIDELITEQNIDRLIKDKKVDRLVTILRDCLRENDDNRYYLKVGRFLKRFADIDINLKNLLTQQLGSDSADSKIAVYVLSIDSENSEAFYSLMDSRGIDWYYCTKAFITTRMQLDYKALVLRLNKFKNYDKDAGDNITKLWNLYLNKNTPQAVLDMVGQFIDDTAILENNINVSLLRLSLEYCKAKKYALDYEKTKGQIKGYANLVWKSLRYKFCSLLTKYYVFFDSPDLFHSNIEWLVNTSTKYSLPADAYGANTVSEITTILPKSIDYKISNKLQLEGNNGLIKATDFELVSDKLINQDLHQRQLPVNYQLLKYNGDLVVSDFAKVEDLKGNIQRKVYWRPVLYF